MSDLCGHSPSLAAQLRWTQATALFLCFCDDVLVGGIIRVDVVIHGSCVSSVLRHCELGGHSSHRLEVGGGGQAGHIPGRPASCGLALPGWRVPVAAVPAGHIAASSQPASQRGGGEAKIHPWLVMAWNSP